MFKKAREFLGAHSIKAGATAVTLVLTLWNLGDVVEWVQVTVPTGGRGEGDNYHLSSAWGWGIVVTFLVLLAIIWLLFWWVQTLAKDRDLKEKKLGAEKALRDNMQAAHEIVHRLFPPEEEKPPFLFEKVERTYMISDGGDTSVRALYRIKAHEDPLQFWRILIAAEPIAPAVDYLDDLHFKLKDLGEGDRARYLVHRDDTHRKELSVFFLPRIAADDKDFRDIQFTYAWPGMVRKLIQEGEEEFSLELKARESVRDLSYTVLFHPSLRRKYSFSCQGVSSAVVASNLKVFESPENGWTGWRYEAHSTPAEGAKYLFRLKCQKRS